MSRRTPLFAAFCAATLLAAPAPAQNPIQSFGEGLAASNDATGTSVALLGDVNGDGGADLLVGAPFTEGNGHDCGSAYVVSTGNPQLVLFEIQGAAGDECGTAVANGGDMDGDGIDDILIGYPKAEAGLIPFVLQDAGRVRVFSGADGSLLLSLGGPQAGSQFGSALAGGKDVNGDGVNDVLVGAPAWDIDHAGNPASNEGWAGIYNGATGALLRSWTGDDGGDELGLSVALVDDLNSDNRADVVLGAPGHDYVFGGPFPINILNGGRVDVYSAYTSLLLFSKVGGLNDRLGTTVAAAGDTDGDGVPEVLAAAPPAAGKGRVVLYEGAAGTLLGSFLGLGLTSADAFGTALSALGDVDKDGHDDFAVGAPAFEGAPSGGYVLMYSGATLQPYLELVSGAEPGEMLGASLAAGPGDVNGDGWPDLFVGRPSNDTESVDGGLATVFELVHHQPNLGFQGPGQAALAMVGTELYSGGEADLHGLNFPGNAPFWLLASAVTSFAPFKGGVLVPSVAQGALFGFAADSHGLFFVPGIQGGGGPFTVYLQGIVQDGAQPQGFGLTNCLAIEFLP